MKLIYAQPSIIMYLGNNCLCLWQVFSDRQSGILYGRSETPKRLMSMEIIMWRMEGGFVEVALWITISLCAWHNRILNHWFPIHLILWKQHTVTFYFSQNCKVPKKDISGSAKDLSRCNTGIILFNQEKTNLKGINVINMYDFRFYKNSKMSPVILWSVLYVINSPHTEILWTLVIWLSYTVLWIFKFWCHSCWTNSSKWQNYARNIKQLPQE